MLSSLPYLSSQAALSGEDLKLGTGFTINQNVCDLKGEGDWGGGVSQNLWVSVFSTLT